MLLVSDGFSDCSLVFTSLLLRGKERIWELTVALEWAIRYCAGPWTVHTFSAVERWSVLWVIFLSSLSHPKGGSHIGHVTETLGCIGGIMTSSALTIEGRWTTPCGHVHDKHLKLRWISLLGSSFPFPFSKSFIFFYYLFLCMFLFYLMFPCCMLLPWKFLKPFLQLF